MSKPAKVALAGELFAEMLDDAKKMRAG